MIQHTNSQILSAVVSHWIQPFVGTIAASKLQGNQMFATIENGIKKWLPVSPNYSLANELSFAITPITKNMIEPYLNQYLSTMPDEAIPQMVHDVVDAMAEKAASDGNVTFFDTLVLDANDIAELKRLLTINMPLTANTTAYELKL